MLTATASIAQTPRLILQSIHVVDVEKGTLLKNQTAAITGDRITSIKKTSTFKPAATESVVDATGRYLIPGLKKLAPDIRELKQYDTWKCPTVTVNRAIALALKANPLEDINNTRQVDMVVVKGRFLGPEAVAGRLQKARKMAGN